jgi:hypothetical protein
MCGNTQAFAACLNSIRHKRTSSRQCESERANESEREGDLMPADLCPCSVTHGPKNERNSRHSLSRAKLDFA